MCAKKESASSTENRRGTRSSVERRRDVDETLSSLHTGENVPLLVVEWGHALYVEYRVSHVHKGESGLPLLYREETVSSPHRGEIVPLLYVEAVDSSSIQMGECLLHTVTRVPLCYL